MPKLHDVQAEQQRALDRVRSLAGEFGLYLAGGTALAFHLGHRTSLDVDLFSVEASLDLEALHRALASFPDFELDSLTDAALRCRLGGVPLDIVRYPYPPLAPPLAGPGSFPIAGLADLATMKLSAAARRGIRRDFWDLYEIFRNGTPSLGDAVDTYVERYGVKESDLYHVLRSLTYFGDAEADAVLPLGMTEPLWQQIRAWFTDNVPRVSRARFPGRAL
jgi:hypothetical protein